MGPRGWGVGSFRGVITASKFENLRHISVGNKNQVGGGGREKEGEGLVS